MNPSRVGGVEKGENEACAALMGVSRLAGDVWLGQGCGPFSFRHWVMSRNAVGRASRRQRVQISPTRRRRKGRIGEAGSVWERWSAAVVCENASLRGTKGGGDEGCTKPASALGT